MKYEEYATRFKSHLNYYLSRLNEDYFCDFSDDEIELIRNSFVADLPTRLFLKVVRAYQHVRIVDIMNDKIYNEKLNKMMSSFATEIDDTELRALYATTYRAIGSDIDASIDLYDNYLAVRGNKD
ncbi:hypothetical protein ABTQ33_10170 [Paucilactobacillus suebicus]|uniref:Uncharacterized protein n=1 Tax=Paucilactobacillus suebicus DSM 5007 = KCTC 3549 TaxID=1423807 RepID=A0A0R1VUK1_9LACO|nr:hypothetical protein [Paucilactobacillus suebicus]KRM09335.1 hypothetical protein FD16_GL001832 [Paucilactobacillus suebicus DSM 5007 = KCTC 3549]